jgi:quercetin dioxygenase-like cupin family protein
MAKRDAIQTTTTARKVAYADAPYILWGDEDSGQVNDILNMVSDRIILAEIRLLPGTGFRASSRHKPIYDADVCIYVLQGEYTVLLPDTGIVRVARKGEVLLLRGPQWHFGHNFGSEETRCLETISPPSNAALFADAVCPSPIMGFEASGGPDNRALTVVRPAQAISAVIGTKNLLRLDVMVDDARVSLALVTVLSGQQSDPLQFTYAATFYVEHGSVAIDNLTDGGSEWLNEGDAFFLPPETMWRLRNFSVSGAYGQIAVAGPIGGDLRGRPGDRG